MSDPKIQNTSLRCTGNRMAEPPLDTVRVLYVGCEQEPADRLATELEDEEPSLDSVVVLSTAGAIEYIESHHVDCVVSRYDLPGSDDGIALLEQLRNRDIWLPFVLVPDASVDVASRAVEAGVDRYQKRTTVEETAESLATEITAAVEEQRPQTDLLDRMTDALLALDDQWRFTYLNEQARDLLGEALEEEQTLSDLRARSIWETAPGVADTQFEQHCREAMATQESRSFESYYETLDCWFDVRLFPSPSGLSVYFYEITDRRRYERTLEHREQVLRDIYSIISDKELPFAEKVEQLLEIGREELGMAYGSLSQIEGREYTLSVVAGPDHEMIAEGTTVDLDETNCQRVVETRDHLALRDTSEEMPELTDRLVYELGVDSYLGAPIFVDDDVDGTFCFYDFEPRSVPFSRWELTLVDLMGSWVSYERERERRRADLERERNRLDSVAGTLSHDIRNPLTTANLRLELAAEDCESEHLGAIESALERIDELIENTLSMARLGPDALDPTPIHLEVLANRAWETAAASDATLRIDEDLGTVIADEATLKQLLENLFANAVEHGSTSPDSQAQEDTGSEASEPSVADAPEDAVEHDTTDTSELVVRVGRLSDDDGFYLADNGPGIPPNKQTEVFERGYSTRSNGTGFGLSIVDQIVDAHDATITVTDSADGGARFEIRGLPIQ